MSIISYISFIVKNRKIVFIFLNLLFVFSISSCSSKKQVLKNDISIHDADKQFIETYSARLGIALKPGCNKRLIETVTSWLNVPYKYGGNTKQGTDCSGFVQQIYAEVYGITLARSATDIFAQCKKINRSELKEGDLVFFKINTSKVGHVGIYLTDEYFIHASTKKGVIVSSLSEEYYPKYFYSAGRIP